ncbi:MULTISPECIES: hypothetical protein [Calothrix]|uniref:Uncharacterized protein n=1 Tax=Calothrix anomala FACHB-343 TaxID=2692894 RepID=A0ABR8ALV1_9CYAN|nr:MULTISPECIES: hypothetical protein [Calothrix]MBD2222983.1 hypothetical protein [Calothrix anomala FACHB-343]
MGYYSFWEKVSNVALAVNSQRSTVNSQQSTVNSQQSTVNSQQSTVNSQQSTVNNQTILHLIMPTNLNEYNYIGKYELR